MGEINVVACGQPLQARYQVAAGTVINYGDFLWYDKAASTPTLKPVGGLASNLVATWSSTQQARRNAIPRFVGISRGDTRSVDQFNQQLLVESMVSCVVNLDSAVTLEAGDLLGFAKDSGGNYLNRNQLTKVTHPFDAVAINLERASSAVTTTRAFVIGRLENWVSLCNLVKRESLYLDGTCFIINNAACVDNYLFQCSARLLALGFMVTAATTGNNAIIAYNGANAIDDSLTVPGASAIGAYVYQAVDDASNYHFFESDSQLDIKTDTGSACSAGAGTLFWEWMPRVAI